MMVNHNLYPKSGQKYHAQPSPIKYTKHEFQNMQGGELLASIFLKVHWR